MPVTSKKQWKYIMYLRNKYGSKDKAPEKDKWVFSDEWVDVDYKSLPEDNKLKRYKSIFVEQ